MKLDCSTVMNTDGATLPFEGNLDFSNCDLPGGVRPFQNPVKVWGKIRNIAGAVELNMSVSAELFLECDRCLKPFTKKLEFSFSADIVTEIHDEARDDLILLKGYTLDIFELAYEHIMLDIPAKHLCDAQCKGLCPVCGTDLNNNECSCDTRVVDPRLEALKNFFS